jgi:hypothetical protein
MDASFRRRKFTELPVQYYTSGRMLWFNDSMETGALLLGYAVESHLKHALSEFKPDAPRPPFPTQFLVAVSIRDFSSVDASDDLLHFIEDQFHQRYPLQAVETSKRASSRGHAVCLSIDLMSTYDAFVVALDGWIFAASLRPRNVPLLLIGLCFPCRRNSTMG